MVRKLCNYGIVVLLCGSAAVGCHRSAVQQKPPPDPLCGVSVKVAGKKPVEGQTESDNHATASQTYPLPPNLPETANVLPAVRTVPLQAYKD